MTHAYAPTDFGVLFEFMQLEFVQRQLAFDLTSLNWTCGLVPLNQCAFLLELVHGRLYGGKELRNAAIVRGKRVLDAKMPSGCARHSSGRPVDATRKELDVRSVAARVVNCDAICPGVPGY